MGKHEKRSGPSTMTIILTMLFITTAAFMWKMIRLFEAYQAVPDTLIVSYFGAVGGECGIMGWIRTTKDRRQERRWQEEDRAREEKKNITEAAPQNDSSGAPIFESQEGLYK